MKLSASANTLASDCVSTSSRELSREREETDSDSCRIVRETNDADRFRFVSFRRETNDADAARNYYRERYEVTRATFVRGMSAAQFNTQVALIRSSSKAKKV